MLLANNKQLSWWPLKQRKYKYFWINYGLIISIKHYETKGKSILAVSEICWPETQISGYAQHISYIVSCNLHSSIYLRSVLITYKQLIT